MVMRGSISVARIIYRSWDSAQYRELAFSAASGATSIGVLVIYSVRDAVDWPLDVSNIMCSRSKRRDSGTDGALTVALRTVHYSPVLELL